MAGKFVPVLTKFIQREGERKQAKHAIDIGSKTAELPVVFVPAISYL